MAAGGEGGWAAYGESIVTVAGRSGTSRWLAFFPSTVSIASCGAAAR